jgi:hypothetical protein
VIF